MFIEIKISPVFKFVKQTQNHLWYIYFENTAQYQFTQQTINDL